jgi:hypothetical protein
MRDLDDEMEGIGGGEDLHHVMPVVWKLVVDERSRDQGAAQPGTSA